ncbi:hypothetical protein [Enterobacter cloacae]
MSALIEIGVRQFIVYECNLFDADFLANMANNRHLPCTREMTVNPEDKFVVISQDCDINNNNQIYIECLILRKTKASKVKKSKQIEKSRNFEKLLLPLYESSEHGYIIHATEKCSLLKTELLDHLKKKGIKPMMCLSERNQEILMKWIVNKYFRRPFPHKFNQLFCFKYLKDEKDSLFQLFETHSEFINEIYFYISPFNDENADRYFVSVTALLHSDCPEEIRDEIDDRIKDDAIRIQNDYVENQELVMLQTLDSDSQILAEHLLEVSDYTIMPDSFLKSAEYQMVPMSVDYFCWKGSEFG